MKNILTVTVGICAYNEERNIQNILKDILSQKTSNFVLKEIIVHCDNCKDKTIEKIKALKNKKIEIIESKTRQGKSGGLAKIIKKCVGEILVIFDADIKLGSKNTISEIITIFETNKQITLVGTNTRPFKPISFFEKVVYTTFLVFEESRKLREYNNPFCFTGQGIAVKSSYLKGISFSSKALNEDDYIYFSAKSDGKKFEYSEKTKIYYKLPKTLPDYLRQCFRSNPQAIKLNYTNRFKDIVTVEYHRPILFFIFAVLKTLIKFPIETIVAVVINSALIPFYRLVSTNYKLEWYSAESTK